MLSRHCPVLYDFPFHHSAALDLTSSAFGFFYAPSLHSLSSLADHARMPKNNVTKRIIPTPIRCITANITSIILFSPFFPMILYNMLFWFFLARMPKNNVTKRIIPTPIRCITANITSIILFSPFFPMILYNMLFWFFLLLYHVLLKCYNWLINSF